MVIILCVLLQIGMMAHLKDMALFKSQALIGGKWIDATDGRTLPVREPMAFL